MRKAISFIMAAVMLLSLGIGAFADGGSYTMHIEGAEKVVYQGSAPASQSASSACNTKLYRLLDTDNMDRSKFSSMDIEFADEGEKYYTAKKQTLIGNNGNTYISNNPEAVFFDAAGVFHASGLGEAEVVVLDTEGNEIDRFTVTVSGTMKKPSIKAPCSQCGEDQGTSMHLYFCGHFVCQGEGGPSAHAQGACGLGGHYKCDGKDHSVCSNCLGYKCNGQEHGVGVCQHVHSWRFSGWGDYYGGWNCGWYWPYYYQAVPMRTCATCGAKEYAWWTSPPTPIFPAPAPGIDPVPPAPTPGTDPVPDPGA